MAGNFTHAPIEAVTPFPKTGDWYNYLNPKEKVTVHSQTLHINVPANSFRIYSTFAP
ncbi:MAG: hypothetical protein PHT18_12320 [Proteiniphilum sp.]|nr:hypothetical protein [Proteiniphilum sp.]